MITGDEGWRDAVTDAVLSQFPITIFSSPVIITVLLARSLAIVHPAVATISAR
jgi:hypothetical protein